MTKQTKSHDVHLKKAQDQPAQSDQSSLGTILVAKYPRILHTDSENLICAEVQADLCLRWAHMICLFCHALAQ